MTQQGKICILHLGEYGVYKMHQLINQKTSEHIKEAEQFSLLTVN
jgi:hypothetical protein